MKNNDEINLLIEKNLYDLFVYIAQKGKRSVGVWDDVKWVKTIPSTWPNFIFDSRIDSSDLESRVQNINIEIENLNAPPLWIFPATQQNNELCSVLEKNGLRLSAQWTGMALDIENQNHIQTPEGLEICLVDNLTLLQEWTTIVSQSLFNKSSLDIDLLVNFIVDDQVKMFIGKCNGVPVASSLMYISNGVAGIYMIATSNEFRKKGFGSAITSFTIAEAAKSQCQTVILHATSAGKSIYMKLGFCEFNAYNIFWKVGKKFKL